MDAVDRLLLDALDLDHEVVSGLSGRSAKDKARELANTLHLSRLSDWRGGSVKIDARRKKLSYTPRQVNQNLISLFRGERYFDGIRDRVQHKDNLDLARKLPPWWRRDARRSAKLDDVIRALVEHDSDLTQAIADLEGEQRAEEWQERYPTARPELSIAPTPADAGVGNLSVPLLGSVAEPTPSVGLSKVMRLGGTPVGPRYPRPVNLFMTLGVCRQPKLAIVSGFEPDRLAEQLAAVELLVTGGDNHSFGGREWLLGPLPAWPTAGAVGAIWHLSDKPSAEDVVRTMIAAFDRSPTPCGNVLVLSLGMTDCSVAEELLNICLAARSRAESPMVRHVEVYRWRAGPPSPAYDQELLANVQTAVSNGTFEHGSPSMAALFTMRSEAGASLGPLWNTADSELVRLHDLSLFGSGRVDSPDALDAARAVGLIAHTSINHNLLYSLAFVPVSDSVVAALAKTSPLARAVAGLLTEAELTSDRPPWSRRQAQGYRPATAAANLFEAETRP